MNSGRMPEMLWNRIEKAVYRPMSPGSASPRGLNGFFADIMASLAEQPRELLVEVDFSESGDAGGRELDFENGEPVFRKAGSRSVRAKFGGKWLAEHPAPMPMRVKSRFRFCPTGGGRVKVSACRMWF